MAPQSGDWDPEEAAVLRTFFLEEAHDHLENIVAALMGLETLGETAPGDRPPPRSKELIDELFRKVHTLKGSASTVGQHLVSEAAHLLEESFVRLRAGQMGLTRATIDTWLSATDLLRETVEATDDERAAAAVAQLRHELAAEAVDGAQRAAAGAAALAAQVTAVAEVAVERAGLPPLDEDTGERELDLSRAGGPSPMQRHSTDGNTLRVEVARVDELMDAASELVFDHTRIDRRAQEIRSALRELDDVSAELGAAFGEVRAFAPPGSEDVISRFGELESAAIGAVAQLDRAARALVDDAEALRRTAVALQQGLTRVRMMSVRWLFARLARPLRDLAREEGKHVDLITMGEDTELDKTVVEQITDPLIHLVRNAVTHGVETTAARVAAGKPPSGRVTIEARQEGDSVYLEVSDDGSGIDPTRLRRALVGARRMTEAQAAATPNDQILASIFEPGVSTRAVADQGAGRGVGLDVVKQNILRLGGDIVVASDVGTGTRFTIRLPLTTAILQALLFKTGGQVYAVPHVHVSDTIAVGRVHGRVPSEIEWEGSRLAVMAFDALLGLPAPADEQRAPVIVLAFGDRQLGLVCDKLVGPREIVVKTLGPLLAPLKLYSGATISAGGKVQLILDVAELVARAPSLAPAHDAPATDDPEVAAERLGIGEVTGEALPLPRVLVVDDSRTMRESIARILGGAGYVIETAVDGREAWDVLLERRFDLMVTDLEMPRMGGYELIARVRRVPALRSLPIIVVSARASDPKKSRALELGAQLFMPKPVSRGDLVKQVDTLIGNAASTR